MVKRVDDDAAALLPGGPRRHPQKSAQNCQRLRAVRAVYTPGMTVGQLEKAAKISRNSASKWRKILIAEGPDEP
jgi:transposase-like protein